MKFIFWQNIVSIHQSSFLNALSIHNEVVLIVEEEIEEVRANQGWHIPQLSKIEVIILTGERQYKNLLLENREDFHFFSGLATFPQISKALILGIHLKMKVGVLSEPFDVRGFKGYLRILKYSYLALKYKKNIKCLFATGNLGVQRFTLAGFCPSRIFSWGYFVEKTKFCIAEQKDYLKGKPTIMFVGALNDRKNIQELIKVARKLKNNLNKFYIIGEGDLEGSLNISANENIFYLGSLANSEINSYMRKSDILILPSKFDGWGAVTNEALDAGMRVLTSDNCGSKVLLDGIIRGESFSIGKKGNMEEVLIKWIAKGSLSPNERLTIKTWSDNNISGNAAALYFSEIIQYIVHEKKPKPEAPWITT